MEMLLQIQGQEGSREVVRVEGSRFTLGRINSSIVLRDRNCSRMHAEVFQDENGMIWVRDLASTNGTFLNGKRVVTAAVLGIDDVLKVGSYTLRVKSLRSGETQSILSREETVTGWPEFLTK